MQRTFFERTQSITGAVLLGLGVLILCGNLDRAVTQLSHFLGTIPPHALGVLPSAVVAASRVVEAYATDHQRFMQTILLDTLASFWRCCSLRPERYYRGILSQIRSRSFPNTHLSIGAGVVRR